MNDGFSFFIKNSSHLFPEWSIATNQNCLLVFVDVFILAGKKWENPKLQRKKYAVAKIWKINPICPKQFFYEKNQFQFYCIRHAHNCKCSFQVLKSRIKIIAKMNELCRESKRYRKQLWALNLFKIVFKSLILKYFCLWWSKEKFNKQYGCAYFSMFCNKWNNILN